MSDEPIGCGEILARILIFGLAEFLVLYTAFNIQDLQRGVGQLEMQIQSK